MFKRFYLYRSEDQSGVSGTGIVARGLKLGRFALIWWPGEWRTYTFHLKGIRSVEHIHGHGGKTQIVWN